MKIDNIELGILPSTYGDPVSVAGRVRYYRDELSISKAKAAKHLGISTAEYIQLESFFDPAAQARHLERLSALFKRTVDWLRDGDPNRLTLTTNFGNYIACDVSGIPLIDSSPYTDAELAQLPFCDEYKSILKTCVKRVVMPFSEYFWYGDEFFVSTPGMTREVLDDVRKHTGSPGWENMRVADQCALLNLPLTEVTASEFSGTRLSERSYGKSTKISVEKFALQVYQAQGWKGFFDEGLLQGVIHQMSMRALRLTEALWFKDQLARKGLPPDGELSMKEAEVVYPERMDSSHRAKVTEAFANLTLERVTQLTRIAGGRKFEPDAPLIFEALKIFGIERILTLMDVWFSGAHSGSGWPDLLLLRDGQLRFVEVKAEGDRLRKNQAMLIRMVRNPMDLPFEILHLLD